jgi:tetratricopeptide (TPR) repeat protein
MSPSGSRKQQAVDTGALQAQADDLASVGEWGAEAEALNAQLLQVDPENTSALARLARCLRDRGDEAGAEELYARLVALDPGNVIAGNFLRAAQRQRDRVIEAAEAAALADRKKAFARRPSVRAVSEQELGSLQEAVAQVPPPGGTYLEGDFVTNVFLTVLDLNMAPATVSKAIRHYRRYRAGEVWALEELQVLLSELPDTAEGNKKLAEYLWNNGYANRAAWMRQLVGWLVEAKVTNTEELRAWALTADFHRDFEDQVKGLTHAAFNGLLMRLGIDTVKPDVLLHTFVENVVGHRVSDDELIRVMVEVGSRLGRSPRELDWGIREQSRGRSGIL